MRDSESAQQQDYWEKQLRNPRVVALFLNTVNIYYTAYAVLIDVGERDFDICVAYTINSLVVYAFLLPSFWEKAYLRFVRFGFMLLSLRQVIYLYDPEQTREQVSIESWATYSSLQILISTYCLNIHAYKFNQEEVGHLAFLFFYLIFLTLGLFVSASGLKETLEQEQGMLLAVSIIGPVLMTTSLVAGETAHQEHLEKMFKHIENQKFLGLILDIQSDALLVLSGSKQIAYGNKSFMTLFSSHIAKAIQTPARSSPRSPDLQQGVKSSVFKTVQRWLRRRDPRAAKAHDITDSLGLAFGASPQENDNFLANFHTLPLAKAARQDAAPPMSFQELIQYEGARSGQVFELVKDSREDHNQTVDQPSLSHSSQPSKSYVRFEFSTLTLQGQERELIKIVDVSDTMLSSQFKQENEMLSILNATVSHELRNPLNSIIGQNVNQQGLLADLDELLAFHSEDAVASKAQKVLAKMRESHSVQDSSAKHMSFLIQDFLDYAQLKSGKFRVDIKSFNVLESIHQVFNIVRQKADQRGILLELEAPIFTGQGGNESPIVTTDEQRLMQVIINLTSNALKFTQEGSVKLTVGIQEADDGNRYLKISVHDTGVGIPYSDQSKLFKLFGFIQSTKQYNKNGAGLGLVISQKIVKKFGGAISFQSVPAPAEGHGATFTFTFKLEKSSPWLPAPEETSHIQLNSKRIFFQDSTRNNIEGVSRQESCDIDDDQPHSRHSPRQIDSLRSYFKTNGKPERVEAEHIVHNRTQNKRLSKSLGEKKRILVVDDQVFNIQALQAILLYKFSISNSLVDHAFNGQEALTMVEKDFEQTCASVLPKQDQAEFDPASIPSSYSLILMDCNMPFMDGFECSQRIRELFNGGGYGPFQQPIITAVTGHAEAQYIKKCFEHGMNQVLSKPVDHAALHSACLQAGFVCPWKK